MSDLHLIYCALPELFFIFILSCSKTLSSVNKFRKYLVALLCSSFECVIKLALLSFHILNVVHEMKYLQATK